MPYTVVVIPDEEVDGSAAYAPAIPNCFTQSPTLEETVERAAGIAAGLLA